MKIDFNSISEHVIPLKDFSEEWRFMKNEHYILPGIHLNQIKPLDKKASKFLWDYISDTGLHNEMPFKKDLFRNLDTIRINDDNKQEIKKWLYQRGLPFEKEVYLSYQSDVALIIPWKLLVKYYDSFYYPITDDLTVIDSSLDWALLFFHEHELYWGTNKNFYPSYMQDLIDDLL
jgi:hypothetical protein